MRDEKGFSLAELLVAAAMTSVLMVAVFTVLQQGQLAYLFGAGRTEAQQTARGAVDRLARELRTGSLVSTATATSVTFQYLDDSGVSVTVQYSLNGTNLQRNQTAPASATPQPETVIGGVNALAFTYYDRDNGVTATAANVRAVRVRLTTQPQDMTLAPSSQGNQKAVVEDRIRLRNLI